MIGYATVGTNDLVKAAAYYDQLFDSIYAQRVFSSERGIVWALSRISAGFGVFLPHDGQPATVGNGSMVALAMMNQKQVDVFFAKALELGGTDEGQRERDERFYVNYFRDPEGNKIGVYHMVERRQKRRER